MTEINLLWDVLGGGQVLHLCRVCTAVSQSFHFALTAGWWQNTRALDEERIRTGSILDLCISSHISLDALSHPLREPLLSVTQVVNDSQVHPEFDRGFEECSQANRRDSAGRHPDRFASAFAVRPSGFKNSSLRISALALLQAVTPNAAPGEVAPILLSNSQLFLRRA